MRPTVAKPDLDIRVLRQFLAVSEAGSMTRAAEQLNVAQPALSQQIQRLERNLQKTLFERHARGVQLTAAGEALAVHARDIHREVPWERKPESSGRTRHGIR